MFRRFGIIPGDPGSEETRKIQPLMIDINPYQISHIWNDPIDGWTKIQMGNGVVFITKHSVETTVLALDIPTKRMH